MGKYVHLDHTHIKERSIKNAINEAYNIVNEYIDCKLIDNKIIVSIYDGMSIEFSYNVGKYKARLLDVKTVNVTRSKAFESDVNLLSLIDRVLFKQVINADWFYTNVVYKVKNIPKKDKWVNVNVYDNKGSRIYYNALLRESTINIIKKRGGFVEYPDRSVHDRLKVRGKANKKARAAIYTNVIHLKKW